MKRIFIPLFLVLSICSFAQQKGNFNTDRFPLELSFVWHEYSPGQRTQSDFVIKEDDKQVSFEFACLPKGNIPERNKTVLFLWEDMPANRSQYDYFKQVLQSFFNEQATTSDDKFNIAVFNRQENDKKLLTVLSDDFLSDKQVLLNKINGYKHNNTLRPSGTSYASDLYSAVNDGLDVLLKQTDSNIRTLVVLTVGYNVASDGTDNELTPMLTKTMSAQIPVYVIQHTAHGTTPKICNFARNSYGEAVSTLNSAEAKNNLSEWYKALNSKHYGFDYQFTFTSNLKRDGKLHNIVLQVQNSTGIQLLFTAPTLTLADWIAENRTLFACMIGLLLVFIAAVILLVRKYLVKKKAEQEAKDREQDEQIQQIQQETKTKKQTEAAQKKEEHRKELMQKMRTLNLYPRLAGNVNGENINFTVSKLETTIGRSGDNDLTLSPKTVSSHHAKIVFNGETFEIFDLDSKNHVVVNGNIVKQIALKHTDMIGLGEVIVTFFL